MTQVAISVPEAIDPDDVIFGEDGSIESMTDPDTGEKIVADPKPEAKPGPRGPGDINPDDNDGPEDDDKPASQRGQAPVSEQELDFLTDTLAIYGLESDEIEWNGEQVSVRELSPEERREFLTELRDRDRAEAAGLSAVELELLDFVRNGGNLAEAFGGQAAPSESAVAALDADGLNRLDIRQQFPDLTDEEVESELEDRKAGKLYDKKTGALKERLVAAEQAEFQVAEQREFEAERAQFTTAAAALTDVFGFPINDAIRQHMLQQTATREQNGNSPFLNSLTPEKVLRLQYLDTFGEQMVQHYEQQLKDQYKKGRTDALQGAPSRPSGRSGSAGSTARGQQRDTSNDSDYTLGES